MNILTKNKKNFIITLLSMALIVSLIAVVALLFTEFSGSSKNATPDISSPTSVTAVDRSVSGKDVSEDKADAVKAVEGLLSAANKYDGDLNVQDRLSKIEKGDFSVTDVEGMKSNIRFAGEFKDDADLQKTTYQALVTLASYLGDSDGVVSLEDKEMAQHVYVDSEVGIAFVPLNIFSNTSNAFSLEMVYMDGEWLMSPYSLLDIVRLSSSVSEMK